MELATTPHLCPGPCDAKQPQAWLCYGTACPLYGDPAVCRPEVARRGYVLTPVEPPAQPDGNVTHMQHNSH